MLLGCLKRGSRCDTVDLLRIAHECFNVQRMPLSTRSRGLEFGWFAETNYLDYQCQECARFSQGQHQRTDGIFSERPASCSLSTVSILNWSMVIILVQTCMGTSTARQRQTIASTYPGGKCSALPQRLSIKMKNQKAIHPFYFYLFLEICESPQAGAPGAFAYFHSILVLIASQKTARLHNSQLSAVRFLTFRSSSSRIANFLYGQQSDGRAILPSQPPARSSKKFCLLPYL